MMTDRSQTVSGLALRRVQDLSPLQRSLAELMHEHQFGRIENMSVRDGQPTVDSTVKVVRVARLGGESNRTRVCRTHEFELKTPVRDLFAELARLQNGTVIRLAFS